MFLSAVMAFAMTAAVCYSQNAPGSLVPGQPSPPAPIQNQPGRVGSNGSAPSQSAPASPNQSAELPMVFQSHGLEYDALTKDGVTVMFAQLPSRLKEFNIIQVIVTNGSLVSWTVRPSDFTFLRADGVTYIPVSADQVVANLLQRADRDDVIKLQLLYENTIYGLSNFRSTNGYEKRREAAMAQFVNKGLKAAVEASAIALVGTRLKPGDSTDGAIFFENHTKEKSLGAGRLVAHTCGQTFYFESYAELKKR
ncbi:MAG TPA: hypothetical protein VHZ55_32820 [Bryobacteraceae bacterium]|jgi:hypothetical protein|nr:hypothetical protein [Bryobacteraceae bacterium]